LNKPRFIQMVVPLPSLKLMAQSRRGVTQVMGVDSLRFPEVDYSSAQNDFGGINSYPIP
jgi:hypothetical protein